MYLAAVIFLLLIVALYWGRRWLASPAALRQSLSWPLLGLLGLTLGLLVYLGYMDRASMQDDAPVLVVLAVDLSLSMGATPDPREHEEVGTRMERARDILQPIMDALDASGASVMIGITGFTAKSEMILAWDNNMSQVNEVLEFVLEPGLLTEPGTDLSVALDGVIPLFVNLPSDYRQENVRKILILVSDGEQTVEQSDMATPLENLRERNIDIVSFLVGTGEPSEGLPIYDNTGEFQGFREIGGEIYTVPDPESMAMVTGEGEDGGLFLRAAEAGTIEELSDYIGIRMSAASTNSPLYLASVLLLLVLTLAILLRFE